MKKLLIITTIIATLSLTACFNNEPKQSSKVEETSIKQEAKRGGEEKPIHEKYAEEIQRQMKAESWRYIYNEALPKDEYDTYFIDFYCFAPYKSVSTWLCITKNGTIDCDRLRITYFD